MFSVAILLVVAATVMGEDKYFVDRQDGSTNVYGSIPTASKSTDYVIFLGVVNSTNDCISTCISYGNTNKTIGRCYSYSYFTDLYPAGDSFKRQCYGRFNDPLWSIIPQNGVNSGRIIWQCTSSMDCSLNGECDTKTGNCSCRVGWSGYRCNRLNLLPANKTSGYNKVNEGVTSWGGAVIIDHNNNDTKTKYHMIISQIVNHCNMGAWTINSQVIHAQSTNGWNSEYEFVDVIKLPFAHEPDIVYGPNGEFVIYYEHHHYNWTCNCTESQSCKKPSVPCYQESMRYTKDITLPMNKWSEEINIFPPTNNSNTHDTNFAMVILKNGSVIGMSRKWHDGSLMYLSLADNWLDNTTYTMFVHNKLLFPQLTGHKTEDPYLYIDCNGGFHAIFHNMSPNTPNSTSDGYLGVVGGHSYSKDGIDWIYAGASYGNVIQYDDGTTFVAHSRERPHFIFDDDNCTPIALTNGVGDKNGHSWTLLQPIKH